MKSKIIDDITKFVFIRDEIEKSDIIFIPGGSHPQLGEYAAQLYIEGFADLIMPSGCFSIKTGRFDGVKTRKELYNKNYLTECEFLTDVLHLNGVPYEVIVGENESKSTKENAYFSRKLVDSQGISIKKAIICCKNFHSRRVLMFYQFAFPDVEFFICPVPYFNGDTELTANNWHKTEFGINRVLGEIQRYSSQFRDEFSTLSNKGEF